MKQKVWLLQVASQAEPALYSMHCINLLKRRVSANYMHSLIYTIQNYRIGGLLRCLIILRESILNRCRWVRSEIDRLRWLQNAPTLQEMSIQKWWHSATMAEKPWLQNVDKCMKLFWATVLSFDEQREIIMCSLAKVDQKLHIRLHNSECIVHFLYSRMTVHHYLHRNKTVFFLNIWRSKKQSLVCA